jgi:hypothetical protein
MKISIYMAVLLLFLLGCASTKHNVLNASPFVGGVDIAVNLGMEHYGDMMKLDDALASTGMPRRMRAMSLNAEQIVVERSDFERAKILVTNIIIRDALTVRVYGSPTSSLLEVWEKGQKIREEPYKLY